MTRPTFDPDTRALSVRQFRQQTMEAVGVRESEDRQAHPDPFEGVAVNDWTERLRITLEAGDRPTFRHFLTSRVDASGARSWYWRLSLAGPSWDLREYLPGRLPDRVGGRAAVLERLHRETVAADAFSRGYFRKRLSMFPPEQVEAAMTAALAGLDVQVRVRPYGIRQLLIGGAIVAMDGPPPNVVAGSFSVE